MRDNLKKKNWFWSLKTCINNCANFFFFLNGVATNLIQIFEIAWNDPYIKIVLIYDGVFRDLSHWKYKFPSVLLCWLPVCRRNQHNKDCVPQVGLWVQVKQLTHELHLHAKVNHLQADNQLSECIYPVALAPVPPPRSVAANNSESYSMD